MAHFVVHSRTEGLAETPSTSCWGLRGTTSSTPSSPIQDEVPADKVGHRRTGELAGDEVLDGSVDEVPAPPHPAGTSSA